MDWKAWRSKGIGSSDAAVIMEESPWKTPRELWLEKTGREVNEVSNWATQRGHELEPRARAHIELMMDCDFPPTLVQHPVFEFLRASLDGYHADSKTVLEIKCPGAEDHTKAKEGNVTKKYWIQIQHQLLVTGAEKAFYFSFTEGGNVIIPVFPDLKFFELYLSKAIAFWKLVESDSPPPLIEADWKSVRSRNLRIYLENYRNERTEFLRRKIFDETKGRRVRLNDYKVDPLSQEIFLDGVPLA